VNESVIKYLQEMGVNELNPVWDSWKKNFVVGYHYECKNFESLDGIMKDLKDLFRLDKLSYSLSEYDPKHRETKFIIFLNNKNELKG
jgi:hypothetical protein